MVFVFIAISVADIGVQLSPLEIAVAVLSLVFVRGNTAYLSAQMCGDDSVYKLLMFSKNMTYIFPSKAFFL